ncbi:DUF2511 domain-containing protein [Halomonas sp. BC1]|uniref:DUF2511 domain-containing protein n=1 Tax=Halomonas sp. BC1 TaxID=1670448 RepID=UPI0009BF0913|nr:DUF2511 domain-containing protein [Halomonas sp. BC1]
MNRVIVLVVLASVFLVSGCSQSGQQVSASEYGEKWPFTVQSGRLDCVQGRAAIFIVGDKKYQLNGFAQSKGYQSITPIWRNNPDIPGAKINIGEMTKLALEQC